MVSAEVWIAMSALVEKYIEAVNRADIDGLTALFTPTATLTQRNGVYRGIAQIAAFYRDLWLGGPSAHEIENQFVDGNAQIVQFKATSPTGETRHAVDVFIVEDGLVESLDIYYR
jgi:hypothetical protein